MHMCTHAYLLFLFFFFFDNICLCLYMLIMLLHIYRCAYNVLISFFFKLLICPLHLQYYIVYNCKFYINNATRLHTLKKKIAKRVEKLLLNPIPHYFPVLIYVHINTINLIYIYKSTCMCVCVCNLFNN